jgi:hypothetical protein
MLSTASFFTAYLEILFSKKKLFLKEKKGSLSVRGNIGLAFKTLNANINKYDEYGSDSESKESLLKGTDQYDRHPYTN